MNPQRFWHSLQIASQDTLSNYGLYCCKESWKRLCYAWAEYKLPARCVLVGIFVLFTGVFCLPTEAYIEGPWLWMIASGADIDSDQLAVASEGRVTENLVAAYGVNEGDTVGQLRWTRGRILAEIDCLLWHWVCYSDNVNRVINRIGLSNARGLNYHSAYALINIVSPRERKNVAMGVGSDDSVKVWLNGKVVHINSVNRSTTGVQDLFRVNLKAGDNLLLVKVSDNLWNWGMFFDIYLEEGSFSTALPVVTMDISLATHLFEKYRVTLQNPEIQEVIPTVLLHLQKPEIQVLLTPLTVEAVAENPDLLAQFGLSDETITFMKGDVGVRAMLRDPDFQTLLQNPNALSEFAVLVTGDEPTIPPEQGPLFADVDGNGVVNILDLVRIVSRFGRTGPDPADINGDRTVDIHDVVLAAAAIHTDRAAPSAYIFSELQREDLELQVRDIRAWIIQAQRLDSRDPTYQRGVIVLRHLMKMLTPKNTTLLLNYPNPFNPETWIPYQLAEPVNVTLTIYALDGTVVRTLALGHQPTGVYQSKARAAYWDGKNELGEPVASGVYFYTLIAGDFTATRKMLIRK